MQDVLSIEKVSSVDYSQSHNAQSGVIDFVARPPVTRTSVWFEWAELLFLILAIYVLVNLLSVRFIVEGPSMEDTFHGDDYLIVSRLSYLIGAPQRGDVIVFHYPGDPNQDYIKRLIGLPGDRIEMMNTEVYVNGEQLSEDYIREACTPTLCRDNSWELGKDEFFVMGDNRNHSSDSRSFQTPVERRHIVGKVVFRYYPFGAAGFIRNGNNVSE